jgi:hypothetical protein
MASPNHNTSDLSAEERLPLSNSTMSPQLADDAATLSTPSPPRMAKTTGTSTYPCACSSILIFEQRGMPSISCR